MTLASALYDAVNRAWRSYGGQGETPVRILRAKRDMKKRYAMGIDPGVSTAAVTYDRQTKKIEATKTLKFWSMYEFMQNSLYMKDDLLVVIEAPPKTRLHEYQDGKAGERYREKIAANVGAHGREAELLADGLERLGFEVRRVTPQRSKLDAKEFARVTGIKERTNQHIRDAVMLVYGL